MSTPQLNGAHKCGYVNLHYFVSPSRSFVTVAAGDQKKEITYVQSLLNACLEQFILSQISPDGEHRDKTSARREEDKDHLHSLRRAVDKGIGRNNSIAK